MADYCPGCHIVVAPHAPDRCVRGAVVWHDSCLQKHERMPVPHHRTELRLLPIKRDMRKMAVH